MDKIISIWGIETNNLKNIDIELEQNAINLIIGPSGSGKSSLAYDTIAQIGQHEFLSMFANDVSEPTYRIKGYKNMIAAVPIKQSNFNYNIRSTIGTYFGINRSVILIYAALLGLNEDFFVLNKAENLCNECHGLGYIRTLDKNKVINYDIPLKKNPIKCWRRYKDFYSQIIQEFCIDNGIDIEKTFRQLDEKEKTLILYGESKKKYSIRYKKNTNFSRRSTKYYGIMTGKPMLSNYAPSAQFFSEDTCKCCGGKKYSKEYDRYKVAGLSIGDFMTMPFEHLIKHIEKIINGITDTSLIFAINNIRQFISKAIEFHLGYLCLHRSIPTLSGGELQRLRMVQVLGTQLSNLLIVLDEPLSGLSGKEKKSVFEAIVELSKRHTIVIVDHGNLFVSVSKKIIALGDGSGLNGGHIIDAKKYIERQSIKNSIAVLPARNMIHINIHNSVYFYDGVDIEIGKDCMNLITGYSGVGKSTLLREYFPQYFENYLYINQKPLLGNSNSSVATVMDIFSKVTKLFAEKYKKDRRFFSNQTGCEGTCSVCMGAGYIEYGNGYDEKIRLICKECAGTGFNKNLRKYSLNGKSIFDVWNMTIDESIEYFAGIDTKLTNHLNEASSILLGHLRIGQPISTLSGGENIRVKILKAMGSTSKVIGIDEPFKGLSNTEISFVVQYLNRLQKNGRTIIVVDHSEEIKHYFAKHIELVCDNRILKSKII